MKLFFILMLLNFVASPIWADGDKPRDPIFNGLTLVRAKVLSVQGQDVDMEVVEVYCGPESLLQAKFKDRNIRPNSTSDVGATPKLQVDEEGIWTLSRDEDGKWKVDSYEYFYGQNRIRKDVFDHYGNFKAMSESIAELARSKEIDKLPALKKLVFSPNGTLSAWAFEVYASLQPDQAAAIAEQLLQAPGLPIMTGLRLDYFYCNHMRGWERSEKRFALFRKLTHKVPPNECEASGLYNGIFDLVQRDVVKKATAEELIRVASSHALSKDLQDDYQRLRDKLKSP